jgi:hypothetical protein
MKLLRLSGRKTNDLRSRYLPTEVTRFGVDDSPCEGEVEGCGEGAHGETAVSTHGFVRKVLGSLLSLLPYCERVVELPLTVADPLVGCAKFSRCIERHYDAGTFSVFY